MTHVVTDACVNCKYTDCVTVCPVDCFHEGEKMLVIDPDICIDCGICVAECPASAIEPESEENITWLERGKHFSKIWPKITSAKAPMKNADMHKSEKNKYDKYIGK